MRIFNSMTRRKEEFHPVHPGEVKIYACGPTVYNYFHIGNARPFIVFDTLRRYMEYRGNKVTFVQNFTDIDDKMIRVASEEGITVKELGERYIGEYFKDAKALNIRPATIHPKATEHIDEIIHLISELIEKRARLPGGERGCLLRREKLPAVWQAFRTGFRGPGGGARIEINDVKRSDGFCALEGAEARRTCLGQPFWQRPAGLAH